jgi:hypothetical protein
MMKPTTYNKSISNDAQLNHCFFGLSLCVFVSFLIPFQSFQQIVIVSAVVPGCSFSVLTLDKACPYAVIFERTIIDLFQRLDEQHDFFGRIPAVHQDEAKQQVLLIDTIGQHVMHMIQLGLAISLRIIDAIVNDPELIRSGIDIHTSYHAHSFDNPMRISTPLPPHQIHLEREILVHDRVIKHQVPIRSLFHLTFHIFPYQVGRDFFACQIAVDRIMAEFLGVVAYSGRRRPVILEQAVH